MAYCKGVNGIRGLSAALAAGALLAGCDTYHFLLGTWQEDSRRPVQALRHYEAFLADRPRDPRACEVRLRAAEIDRAFGRCAEARAHWEAAARDFPRMEVCASRARAGLLSCPDYFPLDAGRLWVYGDSASRGKAMRLEWEVRRSSGPAGGTVTSLLYAGNRRVRATAQAYRREDWAVWRVDGGAREPFLRYPFLPGMFWSARRGTAVVDWLIVSATETVRVAAGEFHGCLKVRERDSRHPASWRYDEYCPDVGRVRTTVAGAGYENPNTELLRFDKMN